MQLSGSSAVVVGGAGGLGEATVRRLHAAGASVVVADLSDEKGKALEAELSAGDGPGARYVRCDATSEDDVQAVMDEAQSLAPLRVSVDCHGGPASGGRLVGKDGSPLALDGFRLTVDVYLTGVFNVMRLAAATMAKNEPAPNTDVHDTDTHGQDSRGVIISTASIAGYEGQIGQIPYAAAKGGVIAMTLVAARDLSPLGIRVVTIAPGMFLTPAYGAHADAFDEAWSPRIPHPQRMGRSPEYARLVQSIVENDYLNGEVIRLDGALRFPPK